MSSKYVGRRVRGTRAGDGTITAWNNRTFLARVEWDSGEIYDMPLLYLEFLD